MSSKKPVPHTRSTIYDSMKKSKPYDDPLKKHPTKFQSSILKVMKEKPQSEAVDMSHKDPYRSTIYDMIKKHPPVERNEKEEERKPIFRADTPPWMPPTPTKPSPPHQGPSKGQPLVSPPWTGIAPGSSVGSVSRTLSLFS
ncbi:hypothetical protein Btru_050767 [Bulinus truncatus]|nr:hypothetical protein Btru_050767 [Bulinus truncatus]